MKKVIYKYYLEVKDIQDIEMPKNSIVLSIQVQDKVPCLWVMVNQNEDEKEKVRFKTIGTGIPFMIDSQESYDFIGSYQLFKGEFVSHVFKIKIVEKKKLLKTNQ